MAIQDTLMNLPDSAFQGPLEEYKKEYKDARKAILTGDVSQVKKVEELKSKVDTLKDWYDEKLEPIVGAVSTFMKYKAAAMMIAKTLEKVNDILASSTGALSTTLAPPLKAIQYAQKKITAAAAYVTKYLAKILKWVNEWKKWVQAQIKEIKAQLEWLFNKTIKINE